MMGRMRHRRVRAMAAAVTLLVTAAACGGTGSASDDDTVKIGVLLPLSGPGAQLGELIKPAVEMAATDANQGDLLAGRSIELVLEDNRAQPGPAVSAMQKLVNVDDVSAVVSSYSSATLAVVPLAEKSKVPVIQSGAQADNLAGASDYLLNGIPLVGGEAAGLMQYLAEEEAVETAAIAFLNDDSGQTTKASMNASAEDAGIDVVAEASHDFEQTDFRASIIKMTAANPDVILLATHSKPAALVAEQLREGGYDGLIAGTTFMTTPDLLASDSSSGLIHSSVQFAPPDAWVERYTQETGAAPAIYSALYYDAVMIYATAIGALAEDGEAVTGEAIRDKILEIGTFEGVTGETAFADDGTVTKPLSINVIEDHKSKQIAVIDGAGAS